MRSTAWGLGEHTERNRRLGSFHLPYSCPINVHARPMWPTNSPAARSRCLVCGGVPSCGIARPRGWLAAADAEASPAYPSTRTGLLMHLVAAPRHDRVTSLARARNMRRTVLSSYYTPASPSSLPLRPFLLPPLSNFPRRCCSQSGAPHSPDSLRTAQPPPLPPTPSPTRCLSPLLPLTATPVRPASAASHQWRHCWGRVSCAGFPVPRPPTSRAPSPLTPSAGPPHTPSPVSHPACGQSRARRDVGT